MNTIKNQENTNKNIIKYLNSKGFKTTLNNNNQVIVGAITITTIKEAIALNKHKHLIK